MRFIVLISKLSRNEGSNNHGLLRQNLKDNQSQSQFLGPDGIHRDHLKWRPGREQSQ
jgi:hypothetical protein